MSVYRGYIDTFTFDEDEKGPKAADDLLRFATIEYPPYLIIYNVNLNDTIRTYKLAGPMYSLVKTVAINRNLR